MDCLMTITNAPGLSAFNPVERRMFHFSKELTGVILPADTHGCHLRNGKTVDEVLEKQNFKAAGDVLSTIWNNLEIDGHEVFAEYIEEKPKDTTATFGQLITPAYRNNHLLEYFTA